MHQADKENTQNLNNSFHKKATDLKLANEASPETPRETEYLNYNSNFDMMGQRAQSI